MNGRCISHLALLVALSAATELSAQSKSPAASAKGSHGYSLAGIGNEARYRVMEELVSIGTNEVVGKTHDIKGRIVVDDKGAVLKDSSKITVNVQTLQTDQRRRDNYLKLKTLATDSFPQVTLVPTSFQGLADQIAPGQEKSFTLLGDLTVRNVTRPTTWQVTAHRQGNDLVGTAIMKFTWEQFNMERPRVVIVRTVADTVQLEYDFHFTPDAGK